MEKRLFSVDEANTLIPGLEVRFGKIMRLRAQLRGAYEDLERLGETPDGETLARSDGTAETRRARGRFRALMEALGEELEAVELTGVLIKDLDIGLCDFIGERDGREVCLCWQYGEKQVRFWHDLDAGFAGRQPIDSKKSEGLLHLILQGKVAVVTGGSRGIGLQIARALAEAGARVAICGRDERSLAAAAESIGALGVRCDVAIFSDCKQLHATVDAQLGVPDVLVNNAGVVERVRLDEMSESQWDHVVDANLKGTFNVTRVFLPQMRARGSGRIVNVASISGRLGTPRLTAYCAAKHGVVGLTRALAEETRDAGIQVNAICPGSVDTDMLKGSGFAPQMSPADIAGVAVYLAGPAPAALTGACIDVFG